MVNRYSLLFAMGVFLLGIAMLLLSVAVWLRFHVEIPAGDIAYFLPFVQVGIAEGWSGISLDDWLAPIAGAHRIVVTRVLMLADFAYFGGKNTAIYLSAWTSLALLGLIYLRAAGSQLTDDRVGRYFILAIVLIFLFTPSQFYNLVNPINASWYVAAASSAISVWLLICARQNLNYWRALFVCLFAAMAAFSNFFGVLTCLVLPALALVQRSRLWPALLLFSATFLLLYLRGIESGGAALANSPAFQQAMATALLENPELVSVRGQILQWLGQLFMIAQRTGQQLGAPLSIKHPAFASLAVLGSVVLLCWYWLRLLLNAFLKKKATADSLQFYLVMATICLGVSCAIWIGRVGIIQVESVRYQTISMVYWLSICCLIYCQVQQLGDPRKALMAQISVSIIPLLFVWGTLDVAMPSVATLHNATAQAQAIGRLGLTPSTGARSASPRSWKDYLADHAEFLRDYGFLPLQVRADNVSGANASDNRCEGVRVSVRATEWPGITGVSLDFSGNANPFLTRLDLFGGNGELGSLHGLAPHEFQLRSILLGYTEWDGYYRGETGKSEPVILSFQRVFGKPQHCALHW